MNIQQLKYFIEVANTGNLSIAARNLFVTQPTLSLAIKKLEDILQIALFTHGGESSFQLTEAGLYLYKNGQRVVDQFDALFENVKKMSDTSDHPKVKIRLGITTLFFIQFMQEISSYLASHPHVDLSIHQDGSPYLQRKLSEGDLDIGLLSFPNLYSKEITLEPLGTSVRGYHVYVVVPNSNPLSKRKHLTFTDLKDQRFSSLTSNFILGRLLKLRASFFGYKPNIVLHNDNLQILLHSITENNSICILPIEYQIANRSDDVKWIPLKDKYSYFPIGIALKKNQVLTKDMTDFIEIIKEN